MAKGKRTNKFGNKKVVLNGITFDSEGEAERWPVLLEQQRLGLISNLERQKTIPAVINGKVVFRYKCDFRYMRGGKRVVEDYKSEFTRRLPDYRIKVKVLRALYNLEIVEVIKEKKRGKGARRGAAAEDGGDGGRTLPESRPGRPDGGG